MPHAPLRPCPRCRRPTHGKCSTCPSESQRRAILEPWRKWYQTKAWKALRLEVLAEAGYRCQCDECGGRFAIPRATDVDHVRPHLGDMAKFFDKYNLRALSHSHHSRKTMRANARWR